MTTEGNSRKNEYHGMRRYSHVLHHCDGCNIFTSMGMVKEKGRSELPTSLSDDQLSIMHFDCNHGKSYCMSLLLANQDNS